MTHPRPFLSSIMEHGRASEWMTSLTLLAFAIVLALPGNSITGPGFAGFRSLGFDEVAIGVPLAIIGTVRISALYINGAWHRSPVVRLIGAVVGAVVFAILGLGFGLPYIVGEGTASPGASTFTVLALADVLAAYRSGADVRVSRRI